MSKSNISFKSTDKYSPLTAHCHFYPSLKEETLFIFINTLIKNDLPNENVTKHYNAQVFMILPEKITR